MVLMQFFSFESLVRFSEIKMGRFASLLWKARETLLILSQPLLQVADQRVYFPRHSQFADIQNLSGELLEFHKTIAKGGDILLVSWINVRSKTPLSASENMWKYMRFCVIVWKCACVTLCVWQQLMTVILFSNGHKDLTFGPQTSFSLNLYIFSTSEFGNSKWKWLVLSDLLEQSFTVYGLFVFYLYTFIILNSTLCHNAQGSQNCYEGCHFVGHQLSKSVYLVQ